MAGSQVADMKSSLVMSGRYYMQAGSPIASDSRASSWALANVTGRSDGLIPGCTCRNIGNKRTVRKAAKCRQKVCSSKRPPKLEPRSVRPNEVFENLASRICPEKQRIGQGRSVREKSVRANDPIKMKKIKGAFSLNTLFVGTVRPPELFLKRGSLPSAPDSLTSLKLREFAVAHTK